MPIALRIAFAVSLGLHAAALFVPEIGTPAPDALPLVAELRPALPESPPAPLPRETVREPEKAPVVKKRPLPRKPAAAPRPVMSTPAALDAAPSIPVTARETIGANEDTSAETPEPAAAPAASVVSSAHLPPRGRIRFRVERGDSGFEIGVARQEWTFGEGRYRLVSSVETTGLVWLIRSVDIDMESIGQISGDGLQPEAFGVRRSGEKARERALFDWETRKIRVSNDQDHALDTGAQDLLSFYYQLAFLDILPGQTGAMPLATGKKYSIYRLENLGDESIDIPLGVLDTRHLRTLGENATEIWLAYEYHLLPVKIRHVDNKGNVFVQVATDVLFGQ
ncbi:MAG: DUF3108 domain-containing protein [Candidatus Accumulibacter sp.]|nr:DUF3108 domain-containing protein [Accumulibacter sp.]